MVHRPDLSLLMRLSLAPSRTGQARAGRGPFWVRGGRGPLRASARPARPVGAVRNSAPMTADDDQTSSDRRPHPQQAGWEHKMLLDAWRRLAVYYEVPGAVPPVPAVRVDPEAARQAERARAARRAVAALRRVVAEETDPKARAAVEQAIAALSPTYSTPR